MANRYDVLTVTKYIDRNGDEKSFFTKIGTMFKNKSGDSFSIEFSALPIGDKDGKVRCYVKEPEQRDGGQQVSRSAARPSARSTAEQIDDDLPF